MAYNFEKYRDKREKVLGVRKRGISFGALATTVAVCIIIGLGAIVVPKAVAYFSTRHLDDAIYKLADGGAWSQELVLAVDGVSGVTMAVTDNHETRLVVTFNRHETGLEKIDALFKNKNVKVDLLNKLGHRERMSILKKEAEFEAP